MSGLHGNPNGSGLSQCVEHLFGGFPENQGYSFDCPHSEDYSILGSRMGSPYAKPKCIVGWRLGA